MKPLSFQSYDATSNATHSSLANHESGKTDSSELVQIQSSHNGKEACRVENRKDLVSDLPVCSPSRTMQYQLQNQSIKRPGYFFAFVDKKCPESVREAYRLAYSRNRIRILNGAPCLPVIVGDPSYLEDLQNFQEQCMKFSQQQYKKLLSDAGALRAKVEGELLPSLNTLRSKYKDAYIELLAKKAKSEDIQEIEAQVQKLRDELSLKENQLAMAQKTRQLLEEQANEQLLNLQTFSETYLLSPQSPEVTNLAPRTPYLSIPAHGQAGAAHMALVEYSSGPEKQKAKEIEIPYEKLAEQILSHKLQKIFSEYRLLGCETADAVPRQQFEPAKTVYLPEKQSRLKNLLSRDVLPKSSGQYFHECMSPHVKDGLIVKAYQGNAPLVPKGKYQERVLGFDKSTAVRQSTVAIRYMTRKS